MKVTGIVRRIDETAIIGPSGFGRDKPSTRSLNTDIDV